MRIFSGIEKSDLLRIEWKQVVEFDREKEEKWKFACLDSRPTSVLCPVFHSEQKRTTFKRVEIGQTRERGKRNSPNFLSSPCRESLDKFDNELRYEQPLLLVTH